jgi:2-methylcitrate dehydratase
MTDGPCTCEHLAAYAQRAVWTDLPPQARQRLKQHILDSLGCALGAVGSGVIRAIRDEQDEFAAEGPCSLIGHTRSTPERAAFYNGALVRYLDYMDSYIALGEACHPSDNLAPILAAAELADASGQDVLVALAVAYHVQCRLTGSGVPIMRAGFDHTIQLALSEGCGIARVLRLSTEKTAHAIALCGTGGLAVGASRTGKHVPKWKGVASASTGFQCLHNVRLAQHGITGPLHLFEGPLGLMTVLKQPFGIDWDKEGYDGIVGGCLKRYNAEEHAQPCIEGLLELCAAEPDIRPDTIKQIHVDIFKPAMK